MQTPRTMKDACFIDVPVEIDHYGGSTYDPLLVGKPSLWERFKMNLDNRLLNKKRNHR